MDGLKYDTGATDEAINGQKRLPEVNNGGSGDGGGGA